jgi:hypothetical protein
VCDKCTACNIQINDSHAHDPRLRGTEVKDSMTISGKAHKCGFKQLQRCCRVTVANGIRGQQVGRQLNRPGTSGSKTFTRASKFVSGSYGTIAALMYLRSSAKKELCGDCDG